MLPIDGDDIVFKPNEGVFLVVSLIMNKININDPANPLN